MGKQTVRRAPDAGVAVAIASITQHAKSKRMLMFGLRSLSDFCVPPTLLYKENSLDVVARGAVSLIANAMQTFCDDDDLVLCGMKVFWGVTEGLKDNTVEGGMASIISGGAFDAFVAALNKSSLEPDTVEIMMKFLGNICDLGVAHDETAIIPGICSILKQGKLSPKTLKLVVNSMANAASSQKGCLAIQQSQGCALALDICIQNGTMDADYIACCEMLFSTISKMASAKCTDELLFQKCVALLEKYKMRKSLAAKGSSALALLVGPEELDKCLKTLGKAPPGSQENHQALSMLSCISYISSYIEGIVKGGGVTILIQLINDALSSGVIDEKFFRTVSLASSMLGRIASNPSNTDLVYQSGGLACLCTAFTYCIENDECMASLCLSLVPLASRQVLADEMQQYTTYSTLLPLLHNRVEYESLAVAALELLATVAEYSPLHSHLLECQAVEILASCCQYHISNQIYQTRVLRALACLSGNISSLSSIDEFGGIDALSLSLTQNAEVSIVASACIELVCSLSGVVDATTYMRKPAVVDAVLNVMLVQEHDPVLLRNGVTILEVIATESDCTRHLNELDKAISAAKRDPDRVFKTFAAISGISSVSSLRNIIKERNVPAVVMAGASGWIEGSSFDGQLRVIQAAISAAKTLELTFSGDLGEFFMSLMNTVLLPQAKRLAETQEPDNNLIIQTMKSAKEIAASQRIDSSRVADCISGTVKVMRKYADSRRVQILCFEILDLLSAGECWEVAFSDSAIIPSVMSSLLQSPMHLDTQIAGFTLLSNAVKRQKDFIEPIRNSDGMNAVGIALRTHSKSKELKRVVGPLIALLMPVEHIEREVRERLEGMEQAMNTKRPADLFAMMTGLNDVLMSQDAIKICTRLKGPELFNRIQQFLIEEEQLFKEFVPSDEDDLPAQDFYSACLAEGVQMIQQLCGTRLGRVACTKNNSVDALISHIEQLLKQKPSAYTEEGIVRAFDALRVLMKHDRGNSNLAYSRGLLSTFRKALEAHVDSESVLASVCGCMASMAIAPSLVQKIVGDPDFSSILDKLIEIIDSSSCRDARLRAIVALNDLLSTNDPLIVQTIGASRGPVSLIKAIELHPNDAEVCREAARALAALGRINGFASLLGDDIRATIQILKTSILANKAEASNIEDLLYVLKLVAPHDPESLRDAGCLEAICEIMSVHSENERIVQYGGEIVSCLGSDDQVKGLMLQIINAVQSGDDRIRKVDSLCVQLAMFLAAPITNPDQALLHTEDCLKALNECLATAPNDIRLLANVSLVSRRLCDRAFNEPDDAYGAWAFASTGQLQVFADTIVQRGCNNGTSKNFLINAFRCLTASAVNPYSREHIIAYCEQSNLLNLCYNLLEEHKSDPDVVARILEFLQYVSEDQKGAKLVLGLRGEFGDVVNVITKIMMANKGSDAVVLAAMKFFGAVAANSGPNAHSSFTKGTIFRDCDLACAARCSPLRDAGLGAMLARFVECGHYNDAIGKHCAIEKLIGRVQGDENMSIAIGLDALLQAFGNLVAAGVSGTAIADAEKLKILELFPKVLQEAPGNSVVARSALQGLFKCADDTSLVHTIARMSIPSFFVESGILLENDPETANTYCDLLEKILATAGTGQILSSLDGFEKTLDSVEALANYYGDEFGNALKAKVANIRKAVAQDKPHVPTCEEVFNYLSERIQNGQNCQIGDNSILLDKLDFLFTRMAEYGAESLKSGTADGEDHKFGSKALFLFAEHIENFDVMIEKEFAKLCYNIFKKQSDTPIVQEAVLALSAFCKYSKAAASVVKQENLVPLSVELVIEQHKKDEPQEIAEAYLIPRIQLIDHLAVNRNVFNKTKVMSALIALWDSCDQKKFSSNLLRSDLRAIRKVVSDAHVEELLAANVLTRLRDIIGSPTPNLVLLPDVLFLFGSLAVVQDIKTKIGEIKGIEACYNLLVSLQNEPKATASMTNCCLALANIFIGHKKNIAIFCKIKGHDLNVQIIGNKNYDYDVTNAASVLLCNVLFKNEDMKKLYGTNGAPSALSQALQRYDVADQKKSLRCLQSLFKAISNLALYTPNVQIFLDAGIENSFIFLLTSAGPEFPDSMLETCFRTLINLVNENDVAYMKKFGVCLDPLMTIAKQKRSEPRLLVLMLDIQANLCRLPESAQRFAHNSGIETTMQIIRQFNCDATVCAAGVNLLRIQAAIETSVPVLLKADIFSVIIGCLETAGGNDVSELLLTSLRCARRLLQNSPNVLKFASDGGVVALHRFICRSGLSSLIALEAYRVLLSCLHICSAVGNAPVKKTDEDEIPDEDLDWAPKPVVYTGLAPHIKLGYSDSLVGPLMQAICAMLLVEEHRMQIRLQKTGLSICTYFASQKIAVEALVQSGLHGILLNIFENFSADPKLILIGCICINNIARDSGDAYDAIHSKELSAALKQAVSKIPAKEKELKALCSATLTAFQSSLDPFEAFASTEKGLDLDLSEHNIELFPNGVQDLPADVKKLLRQGGSFKQVIGDQNREQVVWRANHDLTVFEWNVGSEKDFNNRFSITRLRSITRGLSTESLRNANKKNHRKVTTTNSVAMIGPQSEDFPEGVEISITLKTRKERDTFMNLISMWRQAASSNY